MNAEPHNHELRIERFGVTSLKLIYGDSEELLLNGQLKSTRKVMREARKLKRRHDEGSIQAQRIEDWLDRLPGQINSDLARRGWRG